MPISLSSVNTKTIELFYCICKFPLRLIVAIFDIIFMNYEWDWIDNFEPCIFQVDNYICEACKTLEIEYNKSKYDKENRKIVLPQIIINGKEIKIESFLYLENLKLCFLKCCLKMVGMLIWCLIPLIIITINAGKYSIYIWIKIGLFHPTSHLSIFRVSEEKFAPIFKTSRSSPAKGRA